MADQPYDCDRKRREEKQKNDPTFPSLLAKRARLSTPPTCLERLSTVQRY
jgi:hypothetical protein